VRVDPETRALLEELAWKRRTSISYETREAILRGLQHLQQEAAE
jgi:predicted transcriptional regulator